MALTVKKYLDLTGLTQYDGLIKGNASSPATEASIAGAKKYADEAIAALDSAVNESSATGNVATTAAASTERNVLSGLTIVDGVITNAKAVALEDVAVTGAAEDVGLSATAIADLNTKKIDGYNSGDPVSVDEAISVLTEMISDAAGSAALTIDEEPGAANTNILKSYKFYLGGTQSQGVTTGGSLVGTVNIPKDLVAVSGSVKVATSQNPLPAGDDGADVTSGTYIELVIDNGDPFYIDVADLIEYNTVDDTTEIELDDTNHVITATVGTIAASKISVADAGGNYTATTVEAALAELITKISDLKDELVGKSTDDFKPTSGTADNTLNGVYNAAYRDALAAAQGTASDTNGEETINGAYNSIQSITSTEIAGLFATVTP